MIKQFNQNINDVMWDDVRKQLLAVRENMFTPQTMTDFEVNNDNVTLIHQLEFNGNPHIRTVLIITDHIKSLVRV